MPNGDYLAGLPGKKKRTAPVSEIPPTQPPITPPTTLPEVPSAKPEPTVAQPLTNEQYLENASNLVRDYISRGYWTYEQGVQALQTIHQQITNFGIQGNTFLYEEIVTRPEAEALRLKGKEAVVGLQEKGQRESRLAWGKFNYDREQILASDMTYSQMVGALSNLVNELGSKVSLDAKATYNLLQAAQNDPYKVHPEELERRRGETYGRTIATEPRATTPYGEYPLETTQPFRPPTFEEVRPTLGGPEPWRQWFARQYAQEVSTYMAKTQEPTEKDWADYLRERTPELRERFFSLPPAERGERPWSFQPSIRSVRFP